MVFMVQANLANYLSSFIFYDYQNSNFTISSLHRLFHQKGIYVLIFKWCKRFDLFETQENGRPARVKILVRFSRAFLFLFVSHGIRFSLHLLDSNAVFHVYKVILNNIFAS